MLREVPLFLKKFYNYGPAVQRVYRWAKYGVKGENGRRIYLKAFTVMGKRFCKKSDLLKFLEAAQE